MTHDEARADHPSLRTLRDLGLLLFVAAALVAGLIHYSLARDSTAAAGDVPGARGQTTGGPVAPSTSMTPSSMASASPTSASTSASVSAPTAAGSSSPAPAPTTPSSSVTSASTEPTVACWDGASATRLAGCAPPSGLAGLRWVFPSLGHRGMSCHRAPGPAGGYQTAVARECFATVDDKPVTITFEQVTSAREADESIDFTFAGAERYRIKGAHGGRCTLFDADSNPARVTGYYGGYPYVVSLYADGGDTAKKAWASLVGFRDPGAIRGIRS